MSVYIAPSQGGYERWLDEAADDETDAYECACGWHKTPEQCPHEREPNWK
jgi:hypothetical protein